MSVANLEHSPTPTIPPDYPMGAKGDRQALVALQRRMWRKAHDESVPPHIQAQCARVWRDLQETKRIMDGKPLPGQLRPDGNPLPFLDRRKRKPVTPMVALPDVAPADDSSTISPKESLSQPDRPHPTHPEGLPGSGG